MKNLTNQSIKSRMKMFVSIEYTFYEMDDNQIMADYGVRDIILIDELEARYPIDHYKLQKDNPKLYKMIKETIKRDHSDKSIWI